MRSCLAYVMTSLHRRSNVYDHLPASEERNTIGVLRVVIQTLDITQNYIVRNPNPFVQLGIRGSNDFQSTSWVKSTCSANWVTESFSILVSSLEDVLELRVRDYHRLMRSTSIGVASFPLNLLKSDRARVGQVADVLDEGEVVGRILFDVLYYPVAEHEKGGSSDGNNSGLVLIQIIQADELQIETPICSGPCRLTVTLSLGWDNRPIHITPPTTFSGCPSWNSRFEFLCPDRTNTTVVAKMLATEHEGEPITIGYMCLPLDNLLETMQDSGTWWPLMGCPNGRLKLFATWKPILAESNNRNSLYMF
ncbi:hypothetical protein BJ165DRAFT_555295 [Panaeolus papilionaceus]|nr:hypothetical protein BJ165DRAFT_555295 [Panaeolus papilionaceus]